MVASEVTTLWRYTNLLIIIIIIIIMYKYQLSLIDPSQLYRAVDRV